jgi:phosphatidylethanolamine-binding protein (PEBP) family uncharacterized protein
MIGSLLRPVRAGSDRSPLARPEFSAPHTLTVTSPAFDHHGPIPQRHAGRGVGDNISPELCWTATPPGTATVVLLLDDIDVPLPKPLTHSVALLDPNSTGLAEGVFTTGSPGVRIVPTALGKTGYSGPRPIPGHGIHRYRFHVLALDRSLTDTGSVRNVLAAASGHVLARGTLTGTYRR